MKWQLKTNSDEIKAKNDHRGIEKVHSFIQQTLIMSPKC